MVDTVLALLQEARRKFSVAEIDTAALDARILLLHASGLSHEALVADPDHPLHAEQVVLFRQYVNRRLKHEPVSKIIGRREFYGRDFYVSEHVLDPRADTETLIELSLKYLPYDRPSRIVDLGSGSGAIAVTLLTERSHASCVAVDVSPQARAMTLRNAEALGVAARIDVRDGPWFAKCDGVFDLIVSNPPYISHAEILHLEEDVRNYDPHLALDGGSDGLDCYRVIAASMDRFMAQGGRCVVEIGAGQRQQVVDIFVKGGYFFIDQLVDLGSHVRVLAFDRL